MHKTVSLNQHLPTNRKNESRFAKVTPWNETGAAEIKTSLTDINVNKNSMPHILKATALETFDSYPTTAIKVYTDGSAFKATIFAGYGIHLKFPDGSSEDLCEPCGNICSNYTAEIRALKTAVETVHEAFETGKRDPTDLVIFTDSRSALEALENHQSRNEDNSRT